MKERYREPLKNFDAKTQVNNTVKWIKEYGKENNMKKAIIGISGGKDSTVAAALLAKALGSKNVFGVLMPNGEQTDIEDSFEVVEQLEINHIVVNIKEKYLAAVNSVGEVLTEEARINIAPIVRMETLSTLGQSIGARVCGTGNASERLVGYFTKRGDGQCDFNPLAGYTSLEVMAMGVELGFSERLSYKTPKDGLSHQSDEEKLGISYVDIHNFIRNKIMVSEDVQIKIIEKARKAEHKLKSAPYYKPLDLHHYK